MLKTLSVFSAFPAFGAMQLSSTAVGRPRRNSALPLTPAAPFSLAVALAEEPAPEEPAPSQQFHCSSAAAAASPVVTLRTGSGSQIELCPASRDVTQGDLYRELVDRGLFDPEQGEYVSVMYSSSAGSNGDPVILFRDSDASIFPDIVRGSADSCLGGFDLIWVKMKLADDEKLMHARGLSVSEDMLRSINGDHPIALPHPLLRLLLHKIQDAILSGAGTDKKSVVTKVAFEQIVDLSWRELASPTNQVHDHARPCPSLGLWRWYINKMINANEYQVELAKRAIVTNIWYERGIWAM